MRNFFAAFVATVLVAVTSSGASKPLPGGLEVLVVADAVTDVPEGLRPAPGKPIYYVLGKAQMTVGDSVAGVKMPRPELVEKAVVDALATQGFVRTQVGGPLPSIFIIASWGDANFADLEVPPDPNDADAVANAALLKKTTAASRDRNMIEQLVGTNKRGSQSMSFEAMGKLQAASNENRLYVSLAALDVPAFKAKKRVLLWRTSMTIDWRNKLADALPAMLASAAPFFGTNMDKPVFSDDTDRRKASVDIGELKVMPDEVKPADEAKAKK
jgi:hypothetical protein